MAYLVFRKGGGKGRAPKARGRGAVSADGGWCGRGCLNENGVLMHSIEHCFKVKMTARKGLKIIFVHSSGQPATI